MKINKLAFLTGFCIIFFSLLSNFTIAQTKQVKSSELISLDPKVRFGELTNGFKYFIHQNKTPSNEVEIRLIVKIGSYQEKDDQKQFAHLLEHLAFNGTKHFPNELVKDYFKKVGLVFGIDWNADAGDVTTFRLRLKMFSSNLLDSCLLIMRDWAQELHFDSVGIDKEVGVVLAELRNGNSGYIQEKQIQAQILSHPRYPPNPILQNSKSLETLNHDSLISFYEDWYRADREGIVIVGDIDSNEVENKIRQYFSNLTNPQRSATTIANHLEEKYSVSLNGENRYFLFKSKNSSDLQIELLIKKKSIKKSIKSNRDLMGSLVDETFNQMIHFRLKQITEKYNASLKSSSCYLERNTINPAAMIDGLSIRMSPNEYRPFKDAFYDLFRELEKVKRFGFLSFELTRVKEIILDKYKDTNEPRSSDLANKYVNHFADGSAAPDIQYRNNLVRSLISSITLSDLNSLAKLWLNYESDIDIIIKTPNKDVAFPTHQEINKWIREIKKERIDKFEEPSKDIDCLIDKKSVFLEDNKNYVLTEVDDIGITKIVLPNGIHIILKPINAKGFESDKVLIHGFKSGGAMLYNTEDYAIAKKAGAIVGNAGVGNYDKFKLNAYLSPKGISVSMSIIDSLSVLDGSCAKSEIETLLQYIHLKLTAPRIDLAAFEDWKKQESNDEKMNLMNQQGVFLDFVNKNSYLSIVGHNQLENYNTKNINVESAYRIYKERFVNSGGGTFIVVGDFDKNLIIPLLVKYFGKLPADSSIKNVKYEKHNDNVENVLDLKRTSKTLVYGDNHEAVAHIFFPNISNLTLAAKLKLEILGNILKERVTNRLRGIEGAVYYSDAGVVFSNHNSVYSFQIWFQCNKDKIEHLVLAASEEFERLKSEGVNPEEFKLGISQSRGNTLQSDLSRNRFWIDYLKIKTIKNEDVTEILKRETILSEIIDIDQINEAVKKYLINKNAQHFLLLPE